MRTSIIVLCFSVMLFACSTDKCQEIPGIADISIDLEVEHLGEKLFSLKSEKEVTQFLQSHDAFANFFLQRNQYPHDSILARRIFQLINDPHIDTLYQETMQTYGDFTDIKNEFTNAFKHIKHYYPQFEPPKIQTAITGFANDMYISDSLVIIGLDYFLGEEATFRPMDLPEYILKRYQKEYLVPSVVLLISNHFNHTNYQNKTMLADMIHYGKAYHFTKQMMPCTPDSLLIGYGAQVMEDVEENEDVIWASFLHNEVLYETNHDIKNKFLGERPNVYEIGNKCPGRIGMYIGWEIVDEYMQKNKDVTLQQLMKDQDIQKIFNQSKYRPL